MLQIEVPNGLDGKSLKPILENPTTTVRETVFLPFLDLQRSIRTKKWKIICYPKLGYRQLFDLEADPDEMKNLAEQSDSSEIMSDLDKLMVKAQGEFGDKLVIPKGNKPYPPIDLTGKARETDQWQPEWIVKKYFQK